MFGHNLEELRIIARDLKSIHIKHICGEIFNKFIQKLGLNVSN